MRTNHLLLFLVPVVTVNLLVSAQTTSIAFPPKVLSSDLAAIAKNLEKDINNMARVTEDSISASKYVAPDPRRSEEGFKPDTYIYWPESITFRVRLIIIKEWISEVKYLKIEGDFQYRKLGQNTVSYDGLYYKNGDFFVKISDEEPMQSDTQMMQPVSPDKEMYYVQPTITEMKPFVSLTYFSLNEATENVKSVYENWQTKKEVDTTYCDNPQPCALCFSGGYGQFLYYTYWCKQRAPLKRKVKALIGGKNRVSDLIIRSELVFDQTKMYPALTVREDHNRNVVKNVFGVRTTIEGFDD